MSGMEVLQGVVSIIQLAETTLRIIGRIIEYSDRAASVPKALEPTVHCLPLLCDCVEKLKDRPICALPNVYRVLSGIKTTIVELEKEIKNILPLESDSGFKRIGKGLKSLKGEGKIERLERALGKYQAALGFYIQISEVARSVSPKYGRGASPKLVEDYEAESTERSERFKKRRRKGMDEDEELEEAFNLDLMGDGRYGTRMDSQQPTASPELIVYSDEDNGIVIDGVLELTKPVSDAAPGGVTRGRARPPSKIVHEVSEIGTILTVLRVILGQIFEGVKEANLVTESYSQLCAFKEIDQKVRQVTSVLFGTTPDREEVALKKLLSLGEYLSYEKATVEELPKKSKQAGKATPSLARLVGLGQPSEKVATQNAKDQLKSLTKQYQRILGVLGEVERKFPSTTAVKVRVAVPRKRSSKEGRPPITTLAPQRVKNEI